MRVAWGGVGLQGGTKGDITKAASVLAHWQPWSALKAPPTSLPPSPWGDCATPPALRGPSLLPHLCMLHLQRGSHT